MEVARKREVWASLLKLLPPQEKTRHFILISEGHIMMVGCIYLLFYNKNKYKSNININMVVSVLFLKQFHITNIFFVRLIIKLVMFFFFFLSLRGK